MSQKISEMISATTLNGADIIPLVDTGDNNKTTSIALLRNYMIYNVDLINTNFSIVCIYIYIYIYINICY